MKTKQVILKVLIPKDYKQWIERSAKEGDISEAEVVRSVLKEKIEK